jgi:glycosyltransferase involved in cell wall biosynthesis
MAEPFAQQRSPRPDISVILCTLAGRRDIHATLQSLAAVAAPEGQGVEWLIVENGPDPLGPAAFAGFATPRREVRALHSAPRCKSIALNLALREARGEALLFADDDLRFRPDWMIRMAGPLLSGAAPAVAGAIELPAHLRRPWMAPYHLGWLGCIRRESSARTGEMAGANMGLHRRVLAQVPAYDEELGGGGLGNCEDTLFSRQLIACGLAPHLVPAAVVEHHFQPEKLRYRNWVRNAEAAGRSEAYLQHHWYHAEFPLAALRERYFAAKLALRCRLQPGPRGDAEGIAPWELSYRTSLARWRQYRIERRRPRNYARLGARKLTPA